jgi:hypothetical protein
VRRLLIATAVLLAGPAHAFDYVQCQAIQKSMWQLEENLRVKKLQAGMAMERQAVSELCGSMPTVEYRANRAVSFGVPIPNKEQEAQFKIWMECSDSAKVANRGRIAAAKLNSPTVIQAFNRLQRVKTDFASRCY